MDPALKHRLIGAAVLSAVAVIFLPKLLVRHDTRSTAADVPLKMPAVPGGDFQTRELPLLAPSDQVPPGGVVGMDASHPAPASTAAGAMPGTAATGAPPSASPVATDLPSTTAASGPAKTPAVPTSTATLAKVASSSAPIPAESAGGRYVVSLGTYGNGANANALVASLKKAALPAYAETVSVAGKNATRVRIGPFQQRGDAEAARLKAQAVRTDMPANVIELDAATSAPESPRMPVAKSTPATAVAKPAAPVAAGNPVAGAADISAAAPSLAAAGSGYVVQLVAFRSQDEANALRDKLRAAGFVAYSERTVTETATLYRVRVGPVADRAGADKLRTDVAAKFGVKGIVVAYP